VRAATSRPPSIGGQGGFVATQSRRMAQEKWRPETPPGALECDRAYGAQSPSGSRLGPTLVQESS